MILILVRMSSKCLFTITYLLLCFVISIPFNYATYQLLFTSDGIPAGVDSAHHTYSILKILDTNNPLISYTQFPSISQNSSGYYPSLFHLTLATIAKVAGFNQASATDPSSVIKIEKSFMFAVSLVGTAGYALFIRTLLYKSLATKIGNDLDLFLTNSRYRLLHLIVSILAFSLFIFSVTPIIHLYIDGTYAEVFAMWSIFPYYIYFLVNKRWMLSAFLLSLVASSHNLSFLMSLAATIPYIISLILQRFKNIKKKLMKFILTFFIFAIPALIFFYIPVVTSVVTSTSAGGNPADLAVPWSNSMVAEELKPGLYYMGIICAFLLFILNHRAFGWLSGWIAIYFAVFSLSSLIGVRFGRELSVVFGIVIGICIGYILFVLVIRSRKWFMLFKSFSLKVAPINSSKLILAVIICCVIILGWYLYFHDRINNFSDPLIVKYFTDTIDEANKFFLTTTREGGNSSHSINNRGVIALVGLNPWLKVTTFGKFEVLEIQMPALQRFSGGGDQRINQELNGIFLSPHITSTPCVIEKYDIDFVYVSAHQLPGRFYPLEQSSYIKQLDIFQSFAPSPFLELEQELIGENQEHMRIFSVDKDSVKGSVQFVIKVQDS